MAKRSGIDCQGETVQWPSMTLPEGSDRPNGSAGVVGPWMISFLADGSTHAVGEESGSEAHDIVDPRFQTKPDYLQVSPPTCCRHPYGSRLAGRWDVAAFLERRDMASDLAGGSGLGSRLEAVAAISFACY